ncbi:MAG: carbohydrate-binding family 9-like protein [Myxococcales bacterium]|nr:carbohydrate-binding family 9-like protein [Myxococcales bacterium]
MVEPGPNEGTFKTCLCRHVRESRIPGGPDRRRATPARALALALPLAPALACVDPEVVARAEPPVEATLIAAPGAAAPGKIAPAGGVDFPGGVRITEVELAPAPALPGEPLHVSFSITGPRDGLHGRLALRSPRSASREEVRPTPTIADPRDRAVDLDLGGDRVEADLDLPAPWHPSTVIIELEVIDARGRRVPAIAGPRSADGRAFLGLAPVLRRPTALVAARVDAGAITIDGALDEAAWQGPGAALVESLGGEPHPDPPTEVWLAWDDRHLLVAGRLPDPDLWTTFEAQDDPLYQQEAFEVFVAGDGSGRRYLEYQVAASGLTFDARFPTYRKGDEAWDSAWTTAVQRDGTLNDAGDRDRGWSVEAAIPWDELCAETTITCPPRPGQRLRLNVFRLERPDRKRSLGLALSPTLTPDFHAWQNAAEVELR